MKVKFVPQNIELDVTPDKTLLQIATENGIEIKSICKGVPSCAECRIRVIDGESNVLPPNKAELELIGTNWRIDSRRLACQIRCYGNITVDMTEQIARQENQTKKVRGYRSSRQTETQAVQDTMILTEKPEIREPEPRAEGRPDSRPENPRQGNSERSQGGGRGGEGRRGGGRNRQRPPQAQSQQKQQGPQQGSPQKQGKQQQPQQKQQQAGGRNSGGRGGGGGDNRGNQGNPAKPANSVSKPERPS